MQIKIKAEEIRRLMDVETPEFPKYVTQILNIANQNAQGTRPKVVGQMSELIKEFPDNTLEEWEKWYIEKHPDAVETATKKILGMVENLKGAITEIDEEMVRKWVRDLVIVKTFIGLRFQEAIIKKVANRLNVSYRASTPEEESKGIDGFINGIPISIKPATYSSKDMLSEDIKGHIIFYEKEKTGIKIIVTEELENY